MSLDFSVTHASGVFVKASPERGAAVSICGELLLGNKSELSHNNDGSNGEGLALHTVHCGLKESKARNFQQRRHCNGARLALQTVHCGLKESRARNF